MAQHVVIARRVVIASTAVLLTFGMFGMAGGLVPARGQEWSADDIAKGRSHWAFQRPVDHAPPAVRDAAWPRDPIDRFVLAKLEAAGLAPVADADRATLIRRIAFDLTGLPPTPDETRAFVDDPPARDLHGSLARLDHGRHLVRHEQQRRSPRHELGDPLRELGLGEHRAADPRVVVEGREGLRTHPVDVTRAPSGHHHPEQGFRCSGRRPG